VSYPRSKYKALNGSLETETTFPKKADVFQCLTFIEVITAKRRFWGGARPQQVTTVAMAEASTKRIEMRQSKILSSRRDLVRTLIDLVPSVSVATWAPFSALKTTPVP
jgi:hypothetical protein